ncbi:DUF3017 domain-containing protein [Nocardioides lianchengensis]|uniref:DUF3017 domain-containing protein n=1 Tax=Nocardioides lianchengensis TaxID=1045774 RepID=A0A1G6IUH3_9ACTN|nr:DUF3017 domain-containing protein [Nocardioides lianchengensis]NYG12942.1 hypothetical protein [Nocardioides lianchengensis]SDC10157.1 Protein of unknown function [Nocardioides lianchengensis]
MSDPGVPPSEQPEETPVPTPDEVAAELAAAEAGDGVGPDESGEPDDTRRYPSTIGGAFYLLVLLATGVGLGIVWSGNWRLGVQWMAGALIVAAAVRLVLPRRDAGMLAVRHRLFDCVLLGGVGVALIFLAQTIPDQPGF